MDAPQGSSYRKVEPETIANVRGAMSRRDDFDPSPERYADETHYFEVLAVLEALAIENEILA
jgi:hypothetical protein